MKIGLELSPALSEIKKIYNNNYKHKIDAIDRWNDCCQIHISGWPDLIHYEFLKRRVYKGAIGIELHCETKRNNISLTEIFQKNNGKSINNYEIEYDPNWTKQCGRIRLIVQLVEGYDKIASYMNELINLTFNEINSRVKHL
jgi:hypothetical protein